MPHLYSTLTEPVVITFWEKGPEGMPTQTRAIRINGGHGKADRRTLITPIGVHTEVTDEELELLKTNPSFMRQVKAKFIAIREKKADAEAVASDMEAADKSAQLSEADFEDEPEEKVEKPKKKAAKRK